MQRPEVALSARGREQARRLAARLARERFGHVGHILASDLRRAVMTAEVLRDALGVPLAFDPGLRERDYGDLRGVAYAELTADIFAPDYAPPGGETWETFHARVEAAWERVVAAARREPGDLAVITHGLVCHAVATRKLDLPPGAVVGMRWGNTSLTVIEGPAYRAVRVLDCTAHLEVGTDGGPV